VIFAVRGAHAELRLDLPSALAFAAALLGLIGYLVRSSARGSDAPASGPPPLPAGDRRPTSWWGSQPGASPTLFFSSARSAR
jgi:hypothetical protein